jgi:hypothetical protein
LPWFDRIDSEGAIEDWLAETPASQRTENAITIMGAASKGRSDRIAELLAPHVDHEAFAGWLQWIVRFADLHSSRALFDLLLSTVKSGRYEQAGREMWYSVHELGKHEPGWVVELLATYLVDRPGAMAMDSRQKLDVLSDRDHSMIESVQIAAEGAHELFCIRFLGYILAVISVTAYPSDGERPITDRHFSFRHPGSDPHELDVALLQGVRTALRVLTEQDLPNARPILEFLAENPHDAAQWLLYEALQVAGEELGEWAATLLLEGKYRFLCGYSANNVWTTRQLLQAITPHITNDAFRKLEAEIIGLRFSWESRPGGGYYEFCLLSGFDSSRLSEAARRRLGELRRLHKMDDPLEPKGVTGGFIGSPIPQESARHMTDAHWTRAIAKHAGNRTDWSTLTGSAEELAHVLKAETIRDPFRFARFATSLTADVHPAYPNAILLGFADAEALTDAEPIFDAVRYIASLHIESSDRWLGHSLRKYIKSGVPDDLFALVADRALNATDPTGNDLPVRSNRENGRAVDLYTSGINVARGDAAETLGDMLIFDTDGVRTALIAPLLNRIASDQSMAVRSCVAHVIAACLRHAKSQAVDAFGHLIQGDDLLLATHPVEKLIIFIGNVDQDVVEPVIRRMLASSEFEVRETGGQLAAFAGLEWAADDLFNLVLDSDDMAARKGAAGVCAHRLPRTNNAILAGSALERFFSDAHEEVRKAAAEVASALRGERLRPFRHVIKNVMGSPAFPEAVPQLLITLERASDRVDDLVLECADRFIETYESEVGDFRGRAAGDSRQIGELLLRAYVQATPVATRRRVLDLLDRLLLIDAYGLAELVGAAER